MTTKIGDVGDLIVGAEAIARATGFSQRQVFYLVAKGDLPGSFKLGGKLALSLAAYREGLAARIAAAHQPLAA